MSSFSLQNLPRSLFLTKVLADFLSVKEMLAYRSLSKHLYFTVAQLIEYLIIKERLRISEFEADISAAGTYPAKLYKQLEFDLRQRYLHAYFSLRSMLSSSKTSFTLLFLLRVSDCYPFIQLIYGMLAEILGLQKSHDINNFEFGFIEKMLDMEEDLDMTEDAYKFCKQQISVYGEEDLAL